MTRVSGKVTSAGRGEGEGREQLDPGWHLEDAQSKLGAVLCPASQHCSPALPLATSGFLSCLSAALFAPKPVSTGEKAGGGKGMAESGRESLLIKLINLSAVEASQ